MDSNSIIAAATMVYVILTGIICISNIRATSAARKQTEELALVDKVIGSYVGTDYENPDESSLWFRK